MDFYPAWIYKSTELEQTENHSFFFFFFLVERHVFLHALGSVSFTCCMASADSKDILVPLGKKNEEVIEIGVSPLFIANFGKIGFKHQFLSSGITFVWIVYLLP